MKMSTCMCHLSGMYEALRLFSKERLLFANDDDDVNVTQLIHWLLYSSNECTCSWFGYKCTTLEVPVNFKVQVTRLKETLCWCGLNYADVESWVLKF